MGIRELLGARERLSQTLLSVSSFFFNFIQVFLASHFSTINNILIKKQIIVTYIMQTVKDSLQTKKR